MIWFLVAIAFSAEAAEPDAGVEILFHADLDGRLATPDCAAGAASAAPDYAGLVGALAGAREAAIRAGRPAPLVFLGGNLATPDLFGARLLESPAGLATLSAILGGGLYDAVALGHHELALPPETLNRLLAALEQRGLPVVLTNLTCDTRVRACPVVRTSRMIRTGEISVGVVATIAPSVAAGIPAATWRGMTLDDPLSSARAAIVRLRAQGARWVVLLAQGPRDVRALDDADALARRFGELPPADRPDVILAGGLADDDGERALRLLRRDGSPSVVGAALGTTSLSQVRLRPGEGTATATTPAEITATALPVAGAPADPAVAALLAPEARATCQAYGEPVSPAPVHGTLTREAFTSYVLEVMRRRAGSELALINRAFVKRAPFPLTGTFSRLALHRALPYQAVVGVARLSGAQVESVLGPALDRPELSALGVRKVGGAVMVNGRPLDKVRGYRVATIAFVAAGGDGLVPAGALSWRALPGSPDLRQLVQDFLSHQTGLRDGDPTIDAGSDFGPPAATRPLVVGVSDLGLDLAATSITNHPGYGDAQLVRARQLAMNVDASGGLQVRHPRHEVDGRLALKYGWSRNQPLGGAAVSGETADLITFTTVYNYRGLRGLRGVPSPAVPDPYARVWLESEIDRPAVTATQPRAFHHLQLTNTVGALFTVTPRLRLRGGAGVQRELLASGADGRWRPLLEAGGTLDPVAVASVGALVIKVEGLVDYNFVDPSRVREHQLRGNGKLSVPLLPALFITAGINVFAVQRERLGWGTAYDSTIGLRVHLDAAHQQL